MIHNMIIKYKSVHITLLLRHPQSILSTTVCTSTFADQLILFSHSGQKKSVAPPQKISITVHGMNKIADLSKISRPEKFRNRK